MEVDNTHQHFIFGAADGAMLRSADPREAQATYDSLFGGQVKEPFVVFDWSSARL